MEELDRFRGVFQDFDSWTRGPAVLEFFRRRRKGTGVTFLSNLFVFCSQTFCKDFL